MSGRFARGGLQWNLDLDEGIDFAIWLLGSFERDLVRYYTQAIRPASVALDIGANIGAHTLHLARAVGPEGQVVAVEPTRFAVGKLLSNLALNSDLQRRVHVVHGFLAATADATASPMIPSSWPLTHEPDDPVLGGTFKEVGEARVTTVDELVSNDLALASVDWIKLDVDGNELPVLEGAMNTLRCFRPSIILELAPYCYASDASRFDVLVELLVSNGYALYSLPDERPLPSCPLELRKRHIPENGSINVVAKIAPGGS
ncbi:FkbM family methyltransferase [Congregicoccus parvus]|uniref:FkbM family methyltransferase n=1 Tax=Congregicoccus parvus TaxID=3081749 RepID=UPI003FA5A2E4